jgi:hypothetical protein
MKDTNEFDPTLPTDRQPVTEWDQPMDEADSYVEYLDLSDDEQALGSAGFGMDETYDY